MGTNREQEQKTGAWPTIGPGGSLRRERHYGDREFLCFSERWPDLGSMVREIVAIHGESEAVVGDGRRLTYRDLTESHLQTLARG